MGNLDLERLKNKINEFKNNKKHPDLWVDLQLLVLMNMRGVSNENVEVEAKRLFGNLVVAHDVDVVRCQDNLKHQEEVQNDQQKDSAYAQEHTLKFFGHAEDNSSLLKLKELKSDLDKLKTEFMLVVTKASQQIQKADNKDNCVRELFGEDLKDGFQFLKNPNVEFDVESGSFDMINASPQMAAAAFAFVPEDKKGNVYEKYCGEALKQTEGGQQSKVGTFLASLDHETLDGLVGVVNAKVESGNADTESGLYFMVKQLAAISDGGSSCARIIEKQVEKDNVGVARNLSNLYINQCNFNSKCSQAREMLAGLPIWGGGELHTGIFKDGLMKSMVSPMLASLSVNTMKKVYTLDLDTRDFFVSFLDLLPKGNLRATFLGEAIRSKGAAKIFGLIKNNTEEEKLKVEQLRLELREEEDYKQESSNFSDAIIQQAMRNVADNPKTDRSFFGNSM